MEEPHQRVQSGKLRPSGKRSSRTNSNSSVRIGNYDSIGIQAADTLETQDSDDILQHFLQTPMQLCNLQVEILSNIAKECGIHQENTINKEWRNTWNLGTWHIGNQISISLNIMQPNIAECWATVSSNKHQDLLDITQKYFNYKLEKSICSATKTNNGYQIKGRWSLHAVSEMISTGVVKKHSVELGGLNICQSRLFLWVLVGGSSEYLCTLTSESIELLAKYIPDWCLDIQEPTDAKNITLRVRNPTKINDASHLSISTSGWIQFNGRVDNAARLYGALTVALRSIITSIRLKSFLESLHYDSIPVDF